MVFPMQIFVLFLISLIFSAIGWKKFVYFISLGYGFSVMAMAITMFVSYYADISLAGVMLCSVLAVYGLRLGLYLLIREVKSASYKQKLHELTQPDESLTFGKKMSVWLSVSVLYVTQISPVFYRLDGKSVDNTWAFVGAAIMILALILESVADMQKSAGKKKNPNRFCDKGLYRIVRCPNYFAEILFWTGCLVSGIGALDIWQWIVGAFGYLSIVYIMFGGARRLELRQNKVYGHDSDYQHYVNNTPIILPFVPLYSVAKYTFLRG